MSTKNLLNLYLFLSGLLLLACHSQKNRRAGSGAYVGNG